MGIERLPITRREALVGLVALFGGGVLASPSQALASTGTMQYGVYNDAGTYETVLTSATVNYTTLIVMNTDTSSGQNTGLVGKASGTGGNGSAGVLGHAIGNGPGVWGFQDSSAASAAAPGVLGTNSASGPGVEGILAGAANPSAAIHGVTAGTGPAVLAETTGTGPALEGLVTDSDSSAPAVTAFNGGHGYGLQVNAMNNAQIRMVPSATTGPPASGEHHLGDLFMDAAGVLYRCATSGTPGTWVPVGSGVQVAAKPDSSGFALRVSGAASFSRSGRGSIGKNKQSTVIAVPSGLARIVADPCHDAERSGRGGSRVRRADGWYSLQGHADQEGHGDRLLLVVRRWLKPQPLALRSR